MVGDLEIQRGSVMIHGWRPPAARSGVIPRRARRMPARLTGLSLIYI